jgi:hypothetical protein
MRSIVKKATPYPSEIVQRTNTPTPTLLYTHNFKQSHDGGRSASLESTSAVIRAGQVLVCTKISPHMNIRIQQDLCQIRVLEVTICLALDAKQ